MTPKPAGQFLVYPCPHAYDGEWCGGTAALISHQYECMRCHCTWDMNGEPT